MDTQYEYEVIGLHGGGQDGHCYHWHSDRHGSIGPADCLAKALNERGAKGWHVVAYTSDGRFGNTLVLQRQRTEAALETTSSATQATVIKTVVSDNSEGLKQLAGEIKSMRQDLARAVTLQRQSLAGLELQVPQPLQTVLQSVADRLNDIGSQPVPIEVKTTTDPGAIQQLQANVVSEIRDLQRALIQFTEQMAESQKPQRKERVSWAWPFRVKRNLVPVATQ